MSPAAWSSRLGVAPTPASSACSQEKENRCKSGFKYSQTPHLSPASVNSSYNGIRGTIMPEALNSAMLYQNGR